jgi:undecaprenyl-diphosphatase
VLGVVEGLTEFLPVSSTGHLILTTRALGMDGEDAGVKAFQVVIQAGALLAVIGFYRAQVAAMLKGILGRDETGLRLLIQLFVAFLPAAAIGLLADDWIKSHLFGPTPVVWALAVGGAAMIAVERWRGARRSGGGTPMELAEMTWRMALIIGFAQCLAMWPGTSRSMTTIVAALLLGFTPRAAAEFSFLLALPTLGAATAHDFLKEGDAILHASGAAGLAIGFIVSMIVAWLAVKSFLAWLKRHGLEPFGWYRIAVAGLFAMTMLGAPQADSFQPQESETPSITTRLPETQSTPLPAIDIEPPASSVDAPTSPVATPGGLMPREIGISTVTTETLEAIDERGDTAFYRDGAQPIARPAPAAAYGSLDEAFAALADADAYFGGGFQPAFFNVPAPDNTYDAVRRLLAHPALPEILTRLKGMDALEQEGVLAVALTQRIEALQKRLQTAPADEKGLAGQWLGLQSTALATAMSGRADAWPRLKKILAGDVAPADAGPETRAWIEAHPPFPAALRAQIAYVAASATDPMPAARVGFDAQAVRDAVPADAQALYRFGRAADAPARRFCALDDPEIIAQILDKAGLTQ